MLFAFVCIPYVFPYDFMKNIFCLFFLSNRQVRSYGRCYTQRTDPSDAGEWVECDSRSWRRQLSQIIAQRGQHHCVQRECIWLREQALRGWSQLANHTGKTERLFLPIWSCHRCPSHEGSDYTGIPLHTHTHTVFYHFFLFLPLSFSIYFFTFCILIIMSVKLSSIQHSKYIVIWYPVTGLSEKSGKRFINISIYIYLGTKIDDS